MNIDKKAGHIDPKVALSQAEHEKGTVPGQQIGPVSYTHLTLPTT